MSSPHIHLSLSAKNFWEDDIPFPRCHYGYCQGICVPVCISSSTMWPARTEIGTEPAQRRPHMCDCDGAHIMHTKLSQPQNCHKPRRKRSKRTQSVQVIHPSPVAQQGCARGPGLNLPTIPMSLQPFLHALPECPADITTDFHSPIHPHLPDDGNYVYKQYNG